MAQPLKRFVFLATDGSLCVQGTQADAHGFSASICEICAICGQKKAKLTEGQRPKPYEFSGFTALNTYDVLSAASPIRLPALGRNPQKSAFIRLIRVHPRSNPPDPHLRAKPANTLNPYGTSRQRDA
jgi:hypothetical protein